MEKPKPGTETQVLCLNTDPVKHRRGKERSEVLCLNTELQPPAAHSSKRPQPGREGERATRKQRCRKCCALTQILPTQQRRRDRENRNPEGKRKAESRKGHGDARSSKQHTNSPSLQMQYLSRAKIRLSQTRALASMRQFNSVKVSNETDIAQVQVQSANHPKQNSRNSNNDPK